jgi:hypothetical protein
MAVWNYNLPKGSLCLKDLGVYFETISSGAWGHIAKGRQVDAGRLYDSMKVQENGMGFRILARASAVLILVQVALAVTSAVAYAHEQRDVSKYSLEVGFFVEPAIEGQMNGVELRVTDFATNQPVTGLEKTLQVEITCIPAKASKTFAIEPVDPDGDPGHYKNGLIPTQPGTYSFRFFGTIQGTPVNETFISGPDTFGDVLTAADVQFPQQLPSLRELDGVARDAQAAGQKAQQSSSAASTLAVVGIVLGAIGAGTGAWALAARRKK